MDHSAQHQKEVQLQKHAELIRIRIAADLNDDDNKRLCEVLAIPAARRDENGDIHESKDIFEYVPTEAYRIEVPYDFAKDILKKATADAVSSAVSGLNK
jgi:hypothetical protein